MSEKKKAGQQASEELETAAYNGVSKIFSYLTSFYGDHFATDEDLNRVFVKIVSNMLGDLLGHFPADQRDEVVSWALDNVEYVRAITESEVALDQALGGDEEEEAGEPEKPADLARMIPLGNC